jgi:hypothetical protein
VSISASNQIINGLMDLTRRNTSGQFTLRFGKHKGKTLAEIHLEDPNYIDWLKKALSDKPETEFTDVREAINAFY